MSEWLPSINQQISAGEDVEKGILLHCRWSFGLRVSKQDWNNSFPYGACLLSIRGRSFPKDTNMPDRDFSGEILPAYFLFVKAAWEVGGANGVCLEGGHPSPARLDVGKACFQ